MVVVACAELILATLAAVAALAPAPAPASTAEATVSPAGEPLSPSAVAPEEPPPPLSDEEFAELLNSEDLRCLSSSVSARSRKTTAPDWAC